MASRPTPRELMTLGMFIFGMDSAAYQTLQRSREWRHEEAERFGARAAVQFAGPGPETVTLAGLIVPELGGKYSSLATLADMAGQGASFPLVDGAGVVWGNYRIARLDEEFRNIMAGGAPRQVGFSIELKRSPDDTEGAAT